MGGDGKPTEYAKSDNTTHNQRLGDGSEADSWSTPRSGAIMKTSRYQRRQNKGIYRPNCSLFPSTSPSKRKNLHPVSTAPPTGSPTTLQASLEEIIRRIVEVAHPDRIILFGSAARGELGPDSDIDLLVVKSDVEHRGHLSEDIYMNLSGIGVPVDIVVVTPEDIERFRHKVGTIIRPALRDGREVYAA